MSDQPQVVRPEDHAAFFQAAMRRVLNHYGCIVSVGEDHKALTKGTGVLVDVAGRKLIATAEHVVTNSKMQASTTYLMLARLAADGEPNAGAITGQRMYALDLRSPLWTSKALDVAFLMVGEQIAGSPEARFFNALDNAATTTKLRSKWKLYDSEETSLPYSILGFPNFGHLVDDAAKVELLSALPLPGYVSSLAEKAWDGFGESAPSLTLEIDAHKPVEPPPDLAPAHRAFMDRLHHPPPGVEPFGGYSGGAVMVFGKDGEHLIGIIRDVVTFYGVRTVFASAWDDCVLALTSSDEWKRW